MSCLDRDTEHLAVTLFRLIRAIELDLQAILVDFVLPMEEGEVTERLADTAVETPAAHADPSALSQPVRYVSLGEVTRGVLGGTAELPEDLGKGLASNAAAIDELPSIRNRLHHPQHAVGSDDLELVRALTVSLSQMGTWFPRCRDVLGRIASEVISGESGGKSSRDPVAHNLPPPELLAGHLVGRIDEFRWLRTKLNDPSVTLIEVAGKPGVGKTSLVNVVLQDVIADAEPPVSAVTHVALRSDQGVPASLQIADVPSVLWIDNGEHLLDSELGALSARVTSPSKLLVTSRRMHNLEGASFSLEPMRRSDAVKMLRLCLNTLGAPEMSGSSQSVLPQVISRLNGLPAAIHWLAVELAGGADLRAAIHRQETRFVDAMSLIVESCTSAEKDLLALLWLKGPLSALELSGLSGQSRKELVINLHQLKRTMLVRTGIDPDLLTHVYDLDRDVSTHAEAILRISSDVEAKLLVREYEIDPTAVRPFRDSPLDPNRVEEPSPNHGLAAAALRRALWLSLIGNLSDSEATIADVIRLDPDFHEGYRVAGFVLGRRNQYTDALAFYREAARKAPRESVPRINYELARCLYRKAFMVERDPVTHELLEALSLAIAAHEAFDLPETGILLGRIYMALKRYDQAIELFEAVQHRFPSALAIATTNVLRAQRLQAAELIEERRLRDAAKCLFRSLTISLAVPGIGDAVDSLLRREVLEVLGDFGGSLVNAGPPWQNSIHLDAALDVVGPVLPESVPSENRAVEKLTTLLRAEWLPADERAALNSFLDQRTGDARKDSGVGEIAFYSPIKNTGWLHDTRSGERYFFNKEALTDRMERIHIAPGVRVRYGVSAEAIAQDVVILDGDSDKVFENRSARFFRRDSATTARLKDELNGTTVRLHQLGLRNPGAWADLAQGDRLQYDLEIRNSRYWVREGSSQIDPR